MTPNYDVFLCKTHGNFFILGCNEALIINVATLLGDEQREQGREILARCATNVQFQHFQMSSGSDLIWRAVEF